MILRKEPNSSVDGSYKDNDHSGIVLLGRRLYTDIPNNGLGERNAVDIIHSFGINMFSKFSKNTTHKERTSPANVFSELLSCPTGFICPKCRKRFYVVSFVFTVNKRHLHDITSVILH